MLVFLGPSLNDSLTSYEVLSVKGNVIEKLLI